MARKRYCIPDSTAALTDEVLLREIARGSRVIDLGCGDGRLLQKLRDEHECATVLGVEVDQDEVVGAVRRGVPVIYADLDHRLREIPDRCFDVAVLSQTLQQVRHPREVLMDIMRVAQRALVVVPNFAHWRVRLQVTLQGRAPVTAELPYEWYETPNLHLMSLTDFRDLVGQLNIRVLKELPIVRDRAVDRAWFANWRAVSVLFVLERGPDG